MRICSKCKTETIGFTIHFLRGFVPLCEVCWTQKPGFVKTYIILGTFSLLVTLVFVLVITQL